MSAVAVQSSHDPAARRQAKRSGREKGCWAYIPADVLSAAGIDPDGPAPFYRTWGYRRGPNSASVVVSLYREP